MAKTYVIRGSDLDTTSTVIDPNYNHVSVGCSYFTDSTYDTLTTPTTGTISIQGRKNGNAGWSDLVDSPIDCTDTSDSANTSTPLEEIRAVPTGLDSGIHYQVTITGNSH